MHAGPEHPLQTPREHSRGPEPGLKYLCPSCRLQVGRSRSPLWPQIDQRRETLPTIYSNKSAETRAEQSYSHLIWLATYRSDEEWSQVNSTRYTPGTYSASGRTRRCASARSYKETYPMTHKPHPLRHCQ